MKHGELNELKKRGSDGFPIEYYFLDETHPRYEMPLHWHRDFELVLVKSGQLTLHLNTMEYHLKQGDIAVVNCGVLHRGTPQNCIYECIVCDINILRRSADAPTDLILPIISGQMTVNVLLEADNSAAYSSAVSLFGAMRQASPFFELEVMSRLFAFFFELYKADLVRPHKVNRQDANITRVSELLDWLEDNLVEPITLARLSKMAGLNEKYFCRVFKEVTGKTFTDYLNGLRIDHACRMLLYEKTSVTEAALHSGFSDMSYFSKVFKKHKNCSPRQWVKKRLKGA